MAKRSAEESSLDSLANTIRKKTGSKYALKFPDEMVYAIEQLQSLSTRKSGSVVSNAIDLYLTVPVTDLTKFQAVYLRRIYDMSEYIDDRIIDSLTLFFNEDGATVEAMTVTSYNNASRSAVFYDLNGKSSERVTVTISDSGLEFESNQYFEGSFYGTYYYEVIGI